MSGPDSSPAPARAPLPRAPFVLLALMTSATLFGPLAIILTLRGGAARAWPPDRAVEWITLVGVTALVLGLMAGCVALSVQARRREVAARSVNKARGTAR